MASFAVSLNFFAISLKLKGLAGFPFGVARNPLYSVPPFILTATLAPNLSSRTRFAFTFFLRRISLGSFTFLSVNRSKVTFPSARARAAKNQRLNFPSVPILGCLIPADVKATGPVSIYISSTFSILGRCLAWISSRSPIAECVQAQVGYGLKLISER